MNNELNFSELIQAAHECGDRRKKAYTELKKKAPNLLKEYAEAMKKLGYSSSTWSAKLFHNQVSFATACRGDVYKVKFDFENLIFIEGNEENVDFNGNFFDVFEGEEYPLEFMKNTDGEALYHVVRSLPIRLNQCIQAQKEITEKVEKFIS